MSQKRQHPFLDSRGDPSSELTTLSYDFPAGYALAKHFHEEDQLVFASSGVMTIHTGEGVWIVPPQRAVWIPATVVHSINMSGAVSMRTLYFAANFIKKVPNTCFVINVSPLLRELILHACDFAKLSTKVPFERKIIEIIVDQVKASKAVPLQLPSPSDSRAVRVAEILLADPSDQRALEELCKDCGASKRTIERLFQSETNLTFGKWRQQLRLLHGLRLLASGTKVTAAALEAGYNSPSAFISAFRKTLGLTPGRYYERGVVVNSGTRPKI
ncbi:MAG TPA: helix-turn-helix domain-containing protein [Terriglobia bacterium]|nr:helix-turn-helix domain-containing protein [Terriglobia bacterium]